MHTDRVMELSELPADLVGNLGKYRLMVPEWAFLPNAWSFTLHRGLRKLPLNGRRIRVPGSGSGLDVMLLRDKFPNAEIIYSDLQPRCVPTAILNLNGTVGSRLTVPLGGRWDLLTPERSISSHISARGLVSVHYVVGCLPQMPADGIDLRIGDNLAHYYNPRRYRKTELNTVGLGLNDTLLAQARPLLRPNGKVVLNLAGRPGIKRLEWMFENRGYIPRIIHHEIVPQDQETTLVPLAELEAAGTWTFEFYTDPEGLCQVNAQVAEELRLLKLPVYHRLYVIEGTPRERRRTVRGS